VRSEHTSTPPSPSGATYDSWRNGSTVRPPPNFYIFWATLFGTVIAALVVLTLLGVIHP
jgi:hypothetical protein